MKHTFPTGIVLDENQIADLIKVWGMRYGEQYHSNGIFHLIIAAMENLFENGDPGVMSHLHSFFSDDEKVLMSLLANSLEHYQPE
jgi:hypothetical protein